MNVATPATVVPRTVPQVVPMVVAVDGSPSDRPALRWIGEEAGRHGRRLLISHAVGHLPPGYGYAERREAGNRRRDAGQRVVEEAAAWISRQLPGLEVDTVVRLLDPTALLPSVGRHAPVTTQTDQAWAGWEPGRERTVTALCDAPADAHVVDYAADYAQRTDADLVVLSTSDVGGTRWVPGGGPSITFAAAPLSHGSLDVAQRSWSTAYQAAARLRGPVVLLADTTRASR